LHRTAAPRRPYQSEGQPLPRGRRRRATQTHPLASTITPTISATGVNGHGFQPDGIERDDRHAAHQLPTAPVEEVDLGRFVGVELAFAVAGGGDHGRVEARVGDRDFGRGGCKGPQPGPVITNASFDISGHGWRSNLDCRNRDCRNLLHVEHAPTTLRLLPVSSWYTMAVR